jgi:hypothetical protein
MYSIKQSLITHLIINKLINYIKKNSYNATNIGMEISLYNFHKYNNNRNSIENSPPITDNSFYYLINQINTNYNLNISLTKISIINEKNFFTKFNNKIYKLSKQLLYSFFRGYYFNNLYLYSTNINLSNINSINESLYFVLYDFNSEYLKFIYHFIINLIPFNPKIKFLLNTNVDKYSINELTDNIPYKLVFLHKTKYYNNIIYTLLFHFFNNIYSYESLNDEELFIYNIYKNFNIY